MRRLALLCALVMTVGASRAEAITVTDIIELSKTGLSDEVLLALIEIESKVFPVDPDTVKALKSAGVSERVITAMVRHGRSKPLEPPPSAPVAPPEPAPAPPPQVVVIDHHDDDVRSVREVPVAVPVYVPVYVRTPRHDRRATQVPVARPGVSIGLPHGRIGLSAPPPRPTSDPPYWQKSPYLKP